MLSEFCENMLQLLKEMEQRFYSLTEKQIQGFMHAFRRVSDSICQELLNTKKDYQKLRTHIENDVQINKLEKELKFFRDECLALSEINQSLKSDKVKLLSQIESLKQEKHELQQVMVKREGSKREKENKIELVRNLVSKQFLTPNTSYTSRPRREKNEEKSGEVMKVVASGRQPKVVRRCETPIVRSTSSVAEIAMHERDGRQRAEGTVQGVRGGGAAGDPAEEAEAGEEAERRRAGAELAAGEQAERVPARDHQGHQVRPEADPGVVSSCPPTLSFLTHPRFLSIVQLKIFQEKCCDNLDCKLNLHKDHPREEEDNQDRDWLEDQERHLESKSLRKQLDRYKPEWSDQHKDFFGHDARNVKQKKLEYQHCLASVKFIEKELLSVPKKDRAKIHKMHKQSTRIKGKIRALSQVFQHEHSNL